MARIGSITMRESRRLIEASREAQWEIQRFPDALIPRARAEYAARRKKPNIWDEADRDSTITKFSDDEIFEDDDDLCFAVEQALDHLEIDMVFVEAADSGRGIVLGRPDNKKRTKKHARIICAEDDQMVRVQKKYQPFVLDRETVHARIVAN
jgi:hypothetical protein